MRGEAFPNDAVAALYGAVSTRKTNIVRHILSNNDRTTLFGDNNECMCNGRKLLMRAKDANPMIFNLLLNYIESDASEDHKKLITAIVKGDLKKVESLLKRGVRLGESDDRNGFPSRYVFSKYNKGVRKDIFLLLIDRGYDAGFRVRNYNLLHHFCRSVEKDDTDVVEMAEILMNFGAEIDKFDHLNFTPLVLALGSENIDLVDYLIHRGEAEYQREIVESLYIVAKYHSHGNRSDIFEKILSRGVHIDDKNHLGATALHYACDECDHLTIKFLIENGADLSVRNDVGRTPFSALSSDEENYKKCLLIMIKELARLNFENLPVSVEDLDLIASDKSMKSNFHKCTEELQKMRKVKFYHPYSYHWVMETSKKNLKKLAYLTKNREFVKSYKNDLKKIPLYAYLFRKILSKALVVLKETNYVEKRLALTFGAVFPNLILRKFADNLTAKDLPMK